MLFSVCVGLVLWLLVRVGGVCCVSGMWMLKMLFLFG